MITTIQTYKDIDCTAWSRLVQSSPTGTWFQMPEAYSFFAEKIFKFSLVWGNNHIVRLDI